MHQKIVLIYALNKIMVGSILSFCVNQQQENQMKDIKKSQKINRSIWCALKTCSNLKQTFKGL